MLLLKKQTIMRKVILAMLPCIAGAVYYFGWRSLAVVGVSCATAFVCEYIFCRLRKEPVTEAVFVTGILFALILPPAVPWHVVVIGAVFAIVFTKEVFGGFGRNFFNPAMAGRCFVYLCFPLEMTASSQVWGIHRVTSSLFAEECRYNSQITVDVCMFRLRVLLSVRA